MSTLRDYSLVGEESKIAVEKGLAEAQWYTSPIPRDKMRELLKRKDGPGIRDTLLWFGILGASAFLTVFLWGSWWSLAPYMVYAIIYASTSDSRWHESSHGTAFKTDWMNNTLYEIASFMTFRQSTVWRWSHTRHHSDTLVRGRDPEIAIPRPPSFLNIFLNLFALKSAPAEFRRLLIHASGKIDKEVATYLPESEYGKVIMKARIYLSIQATAIASSIIFMTPFPVMFIILPTLVGSWLMPVYGYTQHAGLIENSLDHRINCRTVYMNRINRYLYWNMNYHIEHHMFPLVPYHALPKLHELMKDDCPPPYTSIINAFKEIIPALIRQKKDPSYYVKREVPTPANIEQASYHPIADKKDIGDDGYVKVCATDKLEINDMIRFDCGENTYAIYRLGDDKYSATEGICTHGTSHLADGLIVDDQIECPKHNGRFKIDDGSVARAPVCLNLKVFDIEIRKGEIYLNTKATNDTKEERYAFKVISNDNVATYIKELILEPLESRFHFKPGDYVLLEIPAHQSSFETSDIQESYQREWKKDNLSHHYAFNHTKTRRNYSMANNPEENNHLHFNVRIALPPIGVNCQAGIGSSYVFNLKPGDTVYSSGPQGDFHIKESDKEIVFIGVGAGMAPLHSQISSLFDTLRTKRKVSLWYGARTRKDLFYLDHLNALDKNNDNFNYTISLSRPYDEDRWDGHTGYIHQALQEQFLNSHQDIKNVEFYLCGPPQMIEDTRKILASNGVEDGQIAFDEF